MTQLRTPSQTITAKTTVAADAPGLPLSIDPWRAAEDKRMFDAKWKNSATPEEREAESRAHLTDKAKRLRRQGLSYTQVGKRLGCGAEKAHAMCDPEFAEHLRARGAKNKRGRSGQNGQEAA